MQGTFIGRERIRSKHVLGLFLLSLMFLLPLLSGEAQETGPSEEFQNFLKQVRTHFLEPLRTFGVPISNFQRAIIIGHALKLQSQYVDSNPSQTQRYNRLRNEVRAFLEGIPSQQSLWPVAEEAERGLHDKEISFLFPIKPVSMKSVFAAFDIPSISADVSILKFFEGNHEGVPSRERVYKDFFIKSDARYIWWELNLTHPAPGEQRNFQIESMYYRPDGSILGQQTVRTYIAPERTSSNHQQGWGWRTAGNWPPGIYRVDLYIERQKIASRSFEIAWNDGDNQEWINIFSLRTRIAGLKFYEGGKELIPYGLRVYREEFSRSKSRYIYWQLDLEHLPLYSPVDFDIDAVWHKPDGSIWVRRTTSTRVQAGWDSSWHVSSWGWDAPGNWSPGIYRLELSIGRQKVATGVFEIVE